MVRLKKSMLYPLSYEGITGFSSPRRRFQHNVSTALQELLFTTLDHSPPFKHVDGSGRISHLMVRAFHTEQKMTPSSLSGIETSKTSAMVLPLLSFTSWLIHATISNADQVRALGRLRSRFAAWSSTTTPLRLSFGYDLAREACER
jgi:hypothetical protein